MKNAIKKIVYVILSMLFITACGSSNNKATNKIDFYKGDIGVIESSTFNNTSYLNIYDLKGRVVSENKVNCVDINSGFLSPIVYKDKVYTNSIGGYSNRSKKVVEFDLKNNVYNTYNIAEGIFTIAAKDKYIFTSNSPLQGSIITKYNIETKKKEKELSVSGLVQHLAFNGNMLYAFSDSDDKTGAIIINIINPDNLQIKKTIKFQSDQSVFDSVNVGKDIFFTHMIAQDGKTPSRILSKFNIDTCRITNINLNEYYPDHIKEYKNKLFITHYNAVTNVGNELTILDLTTNKQQLVKFNHNLAQLEIKNNKLYICDYKNIYVYNLNDMKFLYKFKVYDNKQNYRIDGFFFTT